MDCNFLFLDAYTLRLFPYRDFTPRSLDYRHVSKRMKNNNKHNNKEEE